MKALNTENTVRVDMDMWKKQRREKQSKIGGER